MPLLQNILRFVLKPECAGLLTEEACFSRLDKLLAARGLGGRQSTVPMPDGHLLVYADSSSGRWVCQNAWKNDMPIHWLIYFRSICRMCLRRITFLSKVVEFKPYKNNSKFYYWKCSHQEKGWFSLYKSYVIILSTSGISVTAVVSRSSRHPSFFFIFHSFFSWSFLLIFIIEAMENTAGKRGNMIPIKVTLRASRYTR